MAKKSNKHCNIPIFIPQQACPHQCIYCNQRYISGQHTIPGKQEVKQTIDKYLSTAEEDTDIQVAFFGGTFTALGIEEQLSYLKTVKPYIDSKRIRSVRLSTRPDYINTEILDMLKQYNVTDIELGAQSLDDGVLQYSQRGHTVRDVTEASNLITAYGFNLGLQMMIGLPQDTLQKSIHTAQTIVSLKAVCTRIYPTLVIERTPLAALYRQGQYQPLSIEQAVHWTKEIYKIFVKENVNVLRVGLHPSEDLLNGKGYIAGPFHPSFFELVLTELWKEKFTALPADTQLIKVNPADINYAVGYCSSNLKYLKTVNKNIKILQDATVDRNNFVCL
ncbi:MAG: radical SAM protein [Bacteroidales bacterium]|nr:radical SAM protein [Bacteroidales bacterium]MBP3254737.1 radical SAM protein [Bacteroidales bacterium]